jgi:hypothetical protein
MTAHTCTQRRSSSGSGSVERQLREQILLSVDKILLSEPPSRASLYNLLKLCTPNLPASTLDNAVAREKAFRMVKAKLHPDKFDSSRSAKMTQLFQNVQTYYVQCCHALADEVVGRYGKRSSYTSASSTGSTSTTSSASTRSTSTTKPTFHRTDSPQSVVELPLEFDTLSQFPQLRQMPRQPIYHPVTTTELYYHLAYACLNLRGGVVHGQAIDCTYQVPAHVTETANTSLEQVWAEAGFPVDSSCKRLTRLEDIQHEILVNGPVVSATFRLDPYYYQTNRRHAGNFSEQHVGQVHPLLITGWTMSPHGLVWCVQALRGPPFTIGLGQFDVDQLCLAPSTALLQCKSWQAPGPYWDVPDLDSKCSAWKDHFDRHEIGSGPLSSMVELMPLSSEDIENLADLWNVGLQAVIVERRVFVLRDAVKQAHSRRVLLREMARVEHEGTKTWKVTLSVVRK